MKRFGLGARIALALTVTALIAVVVTTYRVYHYNLDDADFDLGALRSFLLHFAVIWVIASTLLGCLLAFLIVRPVHRATEAARRFGRGELDTRLALRGPAAFTELSDAFNSMAEHLSGTVRDLNESQTLQQRFVADVSHELRTPLSAMVAADEGLDSDDPHVRARSIELVRGQTRRLTKLVDDLLEMSRFDAGQASLQTDDVDVAALVKDVANTVAPDADVRVNSLGDTVASVDVRRIHTVLRNLVANAVQHGLPPVDVLVDGREAAELSVTVADDGPGVPSYLEPMIFDRFVRADAARTSRGEHSGLGLAIALENARLHGATLSLSTSGRTAFTLRLPRRS